MPATTPAVAADAAVKVQRCGTLVNFEIDDALPLEAACRQLREHLGRFRELYAGGEVVVDVGRRMLSDDQKQRIGKVFASESGLSVRQFWCAPDILETERDRISALLSEQAPVVRKVQGVAEPPPAVADSDAPPQSEPQDGAKSPSIQCDATPTLVIRGARRSGETLHLPGNAVILGNVNPGAQIIADGDILVFGALRGLAHAGAAGNADASIVALSAAKPALRIAGYVWDDAAALESPLLSGAGAPGSRTSIIASVQDGAVRVSPYVKNYGISPGGTSPDGMSPERISQGGSPDER